MTHESTPRRVGPGAAHCLFHSLLPVLAFGLAFSGATVQDSAPRSLDGARLSMGRLIETEQLISKERKDWAEGKEILVGRLELIRAEVTSLEEKIQAKESSVAEANKKRDEVLAEKDRLVAIDARLTEAVAGMEGEVQRLLAAVPEPIRAKVQPLIERIPSATSEVRVSAAERFQNVLGILNELNKANNELTVTYEVRELAGGRPVEVRVLYIGLAQAYYVSANGEAGIGRPSPEGWKWESSPAIASDVLTALEIIQGKHTPAFVPLPVTLQ